MPERAELQGAIADALRTYAVEMEQYINTAGATANIHRTDLNGLSHAMEAAEAGTRLTPGELAARMGLSPSATTTMIDRLESAGHIRRSRDSTDRRVVTITITDHAQKTGFEIFYPLTQAFEAVMAHYSSTELQLVHRFLPQTAEAIRNTHSDTRED